MGKATGDCRFSGFGLALEKNMDSFLTSFETMLYSVQQSENPGFLAIDL